MVDGMGGIQSQQIRGGKGMYGKEREARSMDVGKVSEDGLRV